MLKPIVPLFTASAATMLLMAVIVAPAHASQPCKESRSVELTLDQANVYMLEAAIGPGRIDISGNNNDDGALTIEMCASSADRLNAMSARINERASRAVLALDNGGSSNQFRMGLFRSANYGYFNVTGTIPQHWGMELVVGSGKAKVENVASLRATIGSGELDAEDIKGHVILNVGSGDAELERIGSLEISAVGSGDVEVEHIHGNATVGSIGSGSVELEHVAGFVTVSSIGSGKLEARSVADDVSVGTLGSGNIAAHAIEGNVTVRVKGSGSVRTSNVQGEVRVPR